MAYPFELPELGYAYDALEPHIDARTMEIHHSKHHAGYTRKFNAALEGMDVLHGHSAEQILRGLPALSGDVATALRNNGGGYANHALFWDILTPGGPDAPSGDLKSAIEDAFGSVDALKEKVNGAAGSQFGSGWGWVTVCPFGTLNVFSTPNQDSPLLMGHTPILGIDVWEHAYYLHYQNRRPDYLNAVWNVINWDRVAARYEDAKGGWVRTA
ncbi:MAG: superoxide dismutase [Gemmatimonadota bacterium]